eukprot:IDg18600t1
MQRGADRKRAPWRPILICEEERRRHMTRATGCSWQQSAIPFIFTGGTRRSLRGGARAARRGARPQARRAERARSEQLRARVDLVAHALLAAARGVVAEAAAAVDLAEAGVALVDAGDAVGAALEEVVEEELVVLGVEVAALAPPRAHARADGRAARVEREPVGDDAAA